MTVEIAFLDSNVVKARVGRAMKIEKNFNCPPPPPFFRGLATSKLFPNSFNLDGTKRLVSRLFFFYFHSTLERAVSTSSRIGYFPSKSPISRLIVSSSLFSFLLFFFNLLPFFIAESTFPTKRWFRVLNKIREPNSIGIICLSSGRTHVSFQSDGFISCPLINRHFHCPVYARLALLNCTGCHREDRTVNLVELGHSIG